MITRQDLLSGKPFVYAGSFQRLNNRALKYEPMEGKVSDTYKDEVFWLLDSGNTSFKNLDTNFLLFSSKFGKIPLDYSDCELLNEELFALAKRRIKGGRVDPSDETVINEYKYLLLKGGLEVTDGK